MAAGSKPWWVVWYEPVGGHAPGTAPSRFLIIQTAAKSDISASSIGGGAITRIDGPFKTRADAQKDAGKGPVPGTGQITNVQASGGADVRINLSNPLNWLQDIGHWLGVAAHWVGEAVAHILDIYMWRSIGWITLGLVLLVAGIFLWLRKADLIEPAGVSSLRAA